MAISLVHKLAAIACTEVDAAGLLWRVRRIRSSDMAAAALTFAPLVVAPGGDPPRKGKAAPERGLTPNQAREATRQVEALVCAGLVAASEDKGETWETLTVVLTPAEADKDQGRLCIDDLPPGVVAVLGGAILKLATDGGAASEKLAAFRDDAEGGAPRGRARA
jgi:hypothetical protein